MDYGDEPPPFSRDDRETDKLIAKIEEERDAALARASTAEQELTRKKAISDEYIKETDAHLEQRSDRCDALEARATTAERERDLERAARVEVLSRLHDVAEYNRQYGQGIGTCLQVGVRMQEILDAARCATTVPTPAPKVPDVEPVTHVVEYLGACGDCECTTHEGGLCDCECHEEEAADAE